jgi:predicted RNase H-like nuclease
MKTTFVGVDCATDPKKTGLALASVHDFQIQVHEVTTGKTKSPVSIIHDWIMDSEQVLLALDAPLGWPAALGEGLAQHQTGETLEAPADRLFRRETDRFVKQLTGKQPLDVGADRIARTAHAALALLAELRTLTSCPIPLAWKPNLSDRVQVIEVYPAGTLSALGLPSSGYKKSSDRSVREAILKAIEEYVDLSCISAEQLLEDDDLLDAVVCVIAGADFLIGESVPPHDQELAAKEGWIWVRPPVLPR